MSRLCVIFCAAMVLGASGCAATIDVYGYRPRPLPSGVEPLAAVSWSLRELKNVNWGSDQTMSWQRARVGADARGIAASTHFQIESRIAPIYITYGEIASNVRAVSCHEGVWTVHIAHGVKGVIEMQFRTERAARVFLDAATILASNAVATL